MHLRFDFSARSSPRLGQTTRWFLLASAVLLLGLSGCTGGTGGGPARYGVSGKVTLDGKPLDRGSISFVPDAATKGPSAGSNIGPGGTYSVPPATGLVVGTYRVEIRSSQPTGKKVEVGSPSPPGTMMDEVKESIPETYNVKSTLTVPIKASANTHDFELKSQ